MRLPPYGLCLPCSVHHIRDGDTVEVSFADSTHTWAIRLIDCRAPDRGEEGYEEAKQYAKDVLDDSDISVYIPAPKHTHNLLRNLTFDRVPGWIFVGTEDTLNEIMVRSGHATKDKPKRKPKGGDCGDDK